ncbi:hypothetical protein HNR42_001768 [Deinobacterium chartae]|uniref:Uncharacterized protein n=1 Tax=Deinobacterium chartae TaxID=521158 RepID=A0A841HZH2_9DEIO|nr:hypothetical protein [Deinobacterium chartae]MBB6098343.1 hypothetical protein [Deinobacterium chartae]
MSSILETTVKLLSDLAAPSMIQAALREAAERSGKSADELSVREVEQILKSNVYRALQLSVPASLAKARIQQTINALNDLEGQGHVQSNNTLERQEAQVVALEETARKFNLYFEWPETQKFRSLMSVIREQHGQGRAIPNLLRDASVLKDALERKLQELLVTQGRDVAELKADFERVRSVGGPKVRRLENLIHQIETAQEQSALSSAEIERARKLAAELRKLVESSVVTRPVLEDIAEDVILDSGTSDSIDVTATGEFIFDLDIDDPEVVVDFGELTAEQSSKLLEIDLGEQARTLESLERDFAGVLRVSPELQARFAALQASHSKRELVRDDIAALKDDLQTLKAQLLERQRTELAALKARIESLRTAGQSVGEANLLASVSEGMLDGAALVTDELTNLRELLEVLERQAAEAARLRAEEAAQRERALARQRQALARFTVPRGASAAQAAHLEALRTALQQRTEAGEPDEAAVRALVEAHGQISKQVLRSGEAALSSLRGRLSTLPELPELAGDLAALQGRIEQALAEFAAGRAVDASALEAQGKNLEARYRAAVQSRLDTLASIARLSGASELSARIAALKESDFPDLAALEVEVHAARETKLLAQQREIQEIEAAARDYTDLPAFANLEAQLRQARSMIQSGEIAVLDTAWALLESLSLEAEQQRSNLDARSSAVIEEYGRYRGLEGETIRQLGRLAELLRAQRALGQLSPSARESYVTTLRDAEVLLIEARAEHEAARQVAAALQDPSALEGLLGVFDAFGTTPTAEPGREQAPDPVTRVSANLAVRLQELCRERGVDSVVLVQNGQAQWGELPGGQDALRDLVQATAELSGELRRQPPRLLTLEYGGGALIALLFPAKSAQLLVGLSDITQLSRLLALLGRQQAELNGLL